MTSRSMAPALAVGFAVSACTPPPSTRTEAPASGPHTIRVDASGGHPVNRFQPRAALGAGVDRLSASGIDAMYAPAFLEQVLSAGWGAVSYRLNTELHIEAWHWNPTGTWSDPEGKGYFTGAAAPGAEPIRKSFGYTLPRRGFTRNEGTEEHGFSRLTDGARGSIWKSNPYLSREYTGEDDSLYPQWIVIDLEAVRAIDTLQIEWAEPYARRLAVAYWTGPDAMKQPTRGEWRAFPGGDIDGVRGGTTTHALAPSPVLVRYLRIELHDSSRSCAPRLATDRRNCVGYAVDELRLGTRDAAGTFHDLLRHSPDQQQSATFVSSIDPWHEESNIARHGVQSGLDLFYTSGVTRGLPAMVPVAMLYDVPESAAAEIAYLKQRGYPISHVELGEEPDGQYMMPEHYAQLYLQWATAIHAVDPGLALGGPVFTGQNEDILFWPDARGQASWLGRFVAYLKAHGRLADLGFVSFEHYPYDPCKVEWKDLYDEPRLIRHVIETYRADGVPADVPLLVTEVNIAWQSSQSFVDRFGALWLADYVGAFLTAGGAGSYYFHYLPWPLGQDCSKTWGTFAMFKTDDSLRIQQPTSQFFATRLLTQEWVVPGDDPHEVWPAASDVVDAAGHVLVTAYAVRRPDRQWALLAINKDPASPHDVRVVFAGAGSGRDTAFAGPVSMVVFGPDQYEWHPDGADGYARPAGPLAAIEQPGGADAVYRLPPSSVSVLRGSIE